ncbi:MAG: DUF2723 domain-containing protein [Acidobacteria bacterium]|nr:MAG: DUF2723 domain-containing protein [Acidobacteriota bacterium]
MTGPAGPRRGGLLLAALVAAPALLVYRLTLMPGVGLIDSGELALAAWLPGNAHPPGSPVWLLLGFLFSRLPFGEVAFRMNLFSAAGAAAAAAAIALACLFAGRLPSPRPATPAATPPRRRKSGEPPPADAAPSPPPAEESSWALLAPLAAGLSLAFSRSLWSYATVTEVYATNTGLLAGCVAALFRWRLGGDRETRWLVLSAALFGLSLGVHHGSALACAPALLVVVLARDAAVLRDRFFRSPGPRRPRDAGAALAAFAPVRRAWALAAAGLSAALLPYLYLPLRAIGQPLLNWGDPSTPTRFWWHVSTKWFQVFLFEEPLPEALSGYLALLVRQLGAPGVLAALAGLVAVFRRDRILAAFCLLVPVGNFLVLFAYGASDDSPAFVLPSCLALALLVGEAVRAAVRGLLSAGVRRRPVALAAAAALVVPALALALGWKRCDQSGNRLAPAFASNLMAGIRPNGLLLTAEWIATASPLLYLQHVEGFRPDVTVIDVNLVRRSWYEGYVRRRDPALHAAVRERYAEFQRYLWHFEHDRCVERPAPECALIQGSFERLLSGFVEAARERGRPCYLTADVDPSVVLPGAPPILPGLYRIPAGLALLLSPDDPPAPVPAPEPDLTGLLDGSAPVDREAVADRKLLGLYAGSQAARGAYLLRLGDREGARDRAATALLLEPGNELAARVLAAAAGP